MFRSLVRKLLGKRIIRRRLPRELGGSTLYTSPAIALGWLKLEAYKIDPYLCRVTPRIVSEGDTVWDIGANVGMFSFMAAAFAKTGGRIIAVEPDLWTCGLLQRSIQEAPRDHAPVDLLSICVSGKIGIEQLNIAKDARAANYIDTQSGSTQTGGVAFQQPVLSLTLDWMLEQLPKPDVIKIDIDGAELQTLRAAGNVLKDARPVFIVEVQDPNVAEVTELLHDADYLIFGPHADVRFVKDHALEHAHYNTTAIPAEKLAHYTDR